MSREKRSCFFIVRLTPKERDSLEKFADSEHMMPSEYFRHLLGEDARRRIQSKLEMAMGVSDDEN